MIFRIIHKKFDTFFFFLHIFYFISIFFLFSFYKSLIMINFEAFLLLNDEILKSYSFFEKFLTYYLLKRLVKLLFIKHSKNYTIEVCSCDELNVNNLFYSKNINFYKLQNNRQLLNFLRIILREKKTKFKVYYNKNEIYQDNHSNKWNNELLKMIFFYYNQLRKNKKLRSKKNFFISFSTYIICLLHHENNIIKKKDKKLLLLLFLFFFTTNFSKKKRYNIKKSFFFNKKKKKKLFFNDYQELHDLIGTHFYKIKFQDVQNLFENHLFHIHIFNENGKEGKKNEKKILILCKKTLFHLNEICVNYIKCLNKNYIICNLKNKEQLIKDFFLLKSHNNEYGCFLLRKYIIMNKNKNNFSQLYMLLITIHKKKLISKESMKKIIYFLGKNMCYPAYFKKYLKFFYYKLFFNHKKIGSKCYVSKYNNMKKYQKENKPISFIKKNYIEKKKNVLLL